MNCIKQNRILLSAFLFLAAPALTAQVVQQGVVTEINSNRRPIAGVAILVSGTQPTDSDMKGCFKLNFPYAFPGDLFLVQQIYKKGYELVNDTEVNQWGITAEKKINIVLAPKGYLETSKQKYYHIGITASQKRYQIAVEKLSREKAAQKISKQTYDQEIDSLTRSMQAFNEKLHFYANQFARINRDQINEKEKEAVKLIDEGKIEEAIGIYEKMNLERKMKERIDLRDSAKQNLLALEPALINELELLQNNNPDGKHLQRIDTISRTLARSFPEKIAYGFNYAEFLAYNGKYTEALDEYSILLKPLIISCSNKEIEQIRKKLEHMKQLPEMEQSDILNNKIKILEKEVNDALQLIRYKKQNNSTNKI